MTRSFAADNGGKEMYLKYCASCHESEEKGDGPVSRDLKVQSAQFDSF
jgi:mono/diheme cytochrome c family protein